MLLRNDAAVAIEGVFGAQPSSLFCPSWVARILARLRTRSLDRALTLGADPATSAVLAVHARRLTSPATRVVLATSLKHLAAPRHGRFQVRAVATAEARQLNEISARLRDPAPVYSAGMARLRWLLSDGAGPLYADQTGAWLAEELSIALAALSG